MFGSMLSLAIILTSSQKDGGPKEGNTVPSVVLKSLSKGANVSRWFRYPIQTTNKYYATYIQEPEARYMKTIGLGHVRLCLAPNIVMNQTNGNLIEARIKDAIRAIKLFNKAGLLVVVDIHNENQTDLQSAVWQDKFVTFWTQLGTRLNKFGTDQVVLEIVNEPVFEGIESQWSALQVRLFNTIRAVAPNHTIMATGPNWGGIDGLLKVTPLNDTNVVYSFHNYDPFTFTHQGATWTNTPVVNLSNVPYPSSPALIAPLLPLYSSTSQEYQWLVWYGNDNWNINKMRTNFQRATNWAATRNVPLYCGEFGVYPPVTQAIHRANWFRDFGSVLAQYNVGWSSWGWDEGFGLNRQMVNGKPVIDRVVARALGLNLDADSKY
jgi:endoglucanase